MKKLLPYLLLSFFPAVSFGQAKKLQGAGRYRLLAGMNTILPPIITSILPMVLPLNQKIVCALYQQAKEALQRKKQTNQYIIYQPGRIIPPV
jgi:hypothetical protein